MVRLAEAVEQAFLQYKSTYPNDDYKPRGRMDWHEYDEFWSILDHYGNAYPLKYIYSLATNDPTPAFHTHLARRRLEDCGFQCIQRKRGFGRLPRR